MTQLVTSTELTPLPDDPLAVEAELVALARAHAEAVVEAQKQRYRADPRFEYDATRAEKAVQFFPRFLRHSKGRHQGRPFVLAPIQQRIVRIIFGYRWKAGYGEEAGTRVVRTLWLEVARKNGKSTLLAGIALLMLVADGEGSPEVLSAATDKEQASIIFREAAAMVHQSPELGKILEVLKGAIVCPRLMGAYRVLSGLPEGKHGLNPSGIIVDEVHEQKTRDLIDALHTATGARQQPLEAYATTAGYDRRTICWEMHEIARRVAAGDLVDPSFLPIIFAADEEEDWTDPRALAKANPLLGEAVRVPYLLDQLKRAQETPGYTNTYRRLHLNQWTEQSSKWLDMAAWDECTGPIPWREKEAQLARRRCYGGLDLARVRDFSAFVLVFPPDDEDPHWHVLCRFWLPEYNFVKRMKESRVRLDLWRDEGAILVTPGDTTDFSFIAHQIVEDAARFDLVEVAYDRTFAGEVIQTLADEGIAMVGFGQGFVSMAAPTADLERQVIARELEHGGHPVLTWMAGNVAVRQDPAGCLKPDKDRSGDKIDGIAAQLMGIGRAMALQEVERGIALPPGYTVAVS